MRMTMTIDNNNNDNFNNDTDKLNNDTDDHSNNNGQ